MTKAEIEILKREAKAKKDFANHLLNQANEIETKINAYINSSENKTLKNNEHLRKYERLYNIYVLILS